MASFIDRLDSGRVDGTCVLDWSCPVPFFGDISNARIATVGINPSNREFVDNTGRELQDGERRLPTLRSLGLSRWSDVDAVQLRYILEACRTYFRRNPYDRWFAVLEQLLGETSMSFYGEGVPTACHVDLVPYATANKWGDLPVSEQTLLLNASSDVLGRLLYQSRLAVLILNGQSVVKTLQALTGLQLHATPMTTWALPRGARPPVTGVAYCGTINSIGGVPLSREIAVVGYNHNLQSSFGVTRHVISEIRQWLGTLPEASWNATA
jgi:hypothetical protein